VKTATRAIPKTLNQALQAGFVEAGAININRSNVTPLEALGEILCKSVDARSDRSVGTFEMARSPREGILLVPFTVRFGRVYRERGRRLA
jgi:hypothetical protein